MGQASFGWWVDGRELLAAVVGVALLLPLPAGAQPAPELATARLTDVLAQTIESQGIDAAVAQYRALRAQGFPGVRENEALTNTLGYALLRKGDTAAAIKVLELNAETHPTSGNAYDSLGEAHLAAGNTTLAIENYRRALAFSPRSKSARAAVFKLTGERKAYPPLTLVHIFAGAVGVLAGFASMSLRKGSRWHARAGSVFVASMLGMSGTGAYIASVDPHGDRINVLMGSLTFYLVATAWSIARRRDGRPGLVEWVGLPAILVVTGGLMTAGLDAARSEARSLDGIPAGLYFFFGAVALLAATLDLRLLRRGSIVGGQRIARHLWRMCTAMLIGVSSLFLGQPQVFPEALRSAALRGIPSLVVIALLVYWLRRTLRRPVTPARVTALDHSPGLIPGPAVATAGSHQWRTR